MPPAKKSKTTTTKKTAAPKPAAPTDFLSQARQHLRNKADVFDSGEDTPYFVAYDRMLADKGEHFFGPVHSDTDPVAKAWKRKNKPKAKECFDASQRFVIDTPGAVYCEGYAMTEFGLIWHGWISWKGEVFDFMLEGDAKKRDYIGVTVPTEWLAAKVEEIAATVPVAHMYHLGMTAQFI